MTVEPPFHLLRPEHLPSRAAMLDHVRHSAPGIVASLAAVAEADDATALSEVRAITIAVPLPTDVSTGRPDPAESPGNRDNDRAFGIIRVDGDRPRLLLHSVLGGYTVLLDDAVGSGTDLTSEQWTRLRVGFGALLEYACGVDATVPEGGYLPTPRHPSIGSPEALRRWTRGHHLFMVLIQGLVMAMNGLREAVEQGALPDAEAALDLAVTLMNGSEAALRFAGDFTPEEYGDMVRPTLIPPTAPVGMSGLHWRDHEYLVRQLAATPPVLADLAPALALLRAKFRKAYAATYDAHRFVCARFVGEESGSLLMTPKSKQSAVSVLSRFKRARLQHVPE